MLLFPYSARPLGVLSHEAIIDAAWDKVILPVLKKNYPLSTADELRDAHAYAYGGAVSPDMGFYPLGSHLFTDLIHYVRTAEMVKNILADANNLNQLAFAIGFLSHYYADIYGHPLATNKSVPLVYPKMLKKYGRNVTYAENKISHMRMEFGFDVLETTKGNYASPAYHSWIGFKVDTTVLSKAFKQTYGIDINDVFKHHLSATVDIFRFTIANIIPEITKSGWAAKKNEILKKDSTATSQRFRYKMRLREYNKEYGKGYTKPGLFPSILSVLFKIMPKVGPLRALRFKAPTIEAEKLFDKSFDTILLHFTNQLNNLPIRESGFTNRDYDTGKPTLHCEYRLTDETYGKWLLKLNKRKLNVPTDIRENILMFYQVSPLSKNLSTSKKCSYLYSQLQKL